MFIDEILKKYTMGSYLYKACMVHQANCSCYINDELNTLRWFRDNFLLKSDIAHYYEISPIIVGEIEKLDDSNKIYEEIYNKTITMFLRAINLGDFAFANTTYRNSLFNLEEKFAKPALENKLIKTLKAEIKKRS